MHLKIEIYTQAFGKDKVLAQHTGLDSAYSWIMGMDNYHFAELFSKHGDLKCRCNLVENGKQVELFSMDIPQEFNQLTASRKLVEALKHNIQAHKEGIDPSLLAELAGPQSSNAGLLEQQQQLIEKQARLLEEMSKRLGNGNNAGNTGNTVNNYTITPPPEKKTGAGKNDVIIDISHEDITPHEEIPNEPKKLEAPGKRLFGRGLINTKLLGNGGEDKSKEGGRVQGG